MIRKWQENFNVKSLYIANLAVPRKMTIYKVFHANFGEGLLLQKELGRICEQKLLI